MLFSQPIAFTDALRNQALKRVVALSPAIGSRDVQKFIPAQIRERAFFSARTPYAQYLGMVKSGIERIVQPDVRLTPEGLVPTRSGESISPAQLRAQMKRQLAALGYEPDPEKRGGLQDLSSDRRVNLIIDTQLKMSRGYGSWFEAQDRTVLDVWPADELYRAIVRQNERDWQARWNEARSGLGGRTSATLATWRNGPFVALKNDPIWRAISAFDNPYPPFDYMSGMRVRDVGRRRAIELKVLDEAQQVEPRRDTFADERAGAVPESLPGPLAAALREVFAAGLQAVFSGGA